MQLDSDFMSNGTCNDECIKVEDPCDYYASPVTIDASCRCPHLDAFLPSTLDSGGFGIFSEDGSSSNLNEVDSDGSKRNSINRLHFASLYSRPDVGVMNIGLANKRGDSVRQTVPLSDQNKPILDTSLNEVNRNLAGSNIKRNHQTQHYPFGEEEYKTDVISSGGVSKHYYPIFPGYFMERAKDERMHEKASWEWNIRELDRRKRCRSLETDVTDLTTPTLHDPGTKENLRTGSSESLSSDLTKTDMVASRTSSIPDPLCSEEGKEKRIPTTILHKHHLRHNAKIEESIDLTSNQNGEIHYSQSRFDYLKNMESKLSKQQELLSAAQIDTTNYEHSEKKRKAVSIDRSTQNKQKEEHYPDRLRNGNIKELSKRSENYNVTSCPTSPADHLPAGYQSFIQATKRQEKDVLIAENKVEEWLEVIRQSRVNYWKHQHHSERRNRSCGQVNGWGGNHANTLHHKTNNVTIDCSPYCKQCSTVSKKGKTHVRMPRGDELMMCLECSMIACGPVSLSYNQKSKQHLLQHFLVSGHSFGITCGTLGAIFCMKCGDFVHCEPLEVEKERVDIREKVGWLGWNRTGYVNRSFKFGVGLEDFLLIPDDDFPGGYCNKTDEITSNDDDIMVSDRKNSQNRSKYHGGMVVWRGFRAIYPRNVRNELVQAARRTYHRWKIFHGKLCDDSSLAWSSKALQLSVLQNDRGADCWKIQNPVGFYNMGNICFMSSVLQCIINLTPLQRYFLCEVKHDYEACRELRKRSEDQPVSKPPVKIDVTATKLPDKDDTSICLACEMDKLFLAYHSSTIGMDVSEAIDSPLDPSSSFSPSNHDHFSNDKKSPIGQCITPIDQSEIPTKLNKGEREESCRGTNNLLGMPLIASDLLVSAWRCKEMVHLAGYEQRDAHEFLQALLDLIGKHCNRYRDISKKLRQETISSIQAKGLSTFEVDDDSKSDIEDIVENSFGGSLRSVLMCEACGFKRSQAEPFLNVSLPVAKDPISVHDMGNTNCKGTNSATTHSVTTRRTAKTKINLQACLNQFTSPEPLGDPVHCPSCKVKTSTLKQLTFAKLPKILCLHLKRFDALTNKKITNPVSFPIKLDMGPHLPHWCEVEQRKGGLPNSDPPVSTVKSDKTKDATCPKILFELCGTIDHTGTLNQGHYVSNVKVNGQWYHCNDAFVGRCGKGTGEEEVLNSDSAYMMFYVRKDQS